MERLKKYNLFSKMSELPNSHKIDLFYDIILIVCEYKSITVDDAGVKKIAKFILYFVNNKYKHLTVANIITALELGLMGEFGKSFTKVSADVINGWIAEVARQIAANINLRMSKQNFESNNPDKENSEDDKVYGEAVLCRQVYDPDREISNRDNITLEEIAEGIKDGFNIFTAEKYDYEEMLKISNDRSKYKRSGRIRSIGDIISGK